MSEYPLDVVSQQNPLDEDVTESKNTSALSLSMPLSAFIKEAEKD